MRMKTSGIKKFFLGFLAVIAIALSSISYADNPIIQTKFTADPAPMVYRDTVFLYTGHDEDDALGFKMLNWMLYTSTDMVNWTDRGIVASLEIFSWAGKNGAWAPQCINRNGKFYLYCPVAQKNGGMAIGVTVSDSPYGPFTDPLGKPLIANSSDDIDPTVYIDDDGQAYLYWGNPNCYYVKLNKDMISYSGDLVKIDSKPPNYQEGPWLWKHNRFYYLAYASTCCPEGIGYAMDNSPTGPWQYKGMIVDSDQRSSGNHPGIIDYKGNSYVFGFNYAINFSLTKIHRERRSVCVEKMTYNPDGTIQELPWWSEKGAPQIGTLNPYIRNEAETIAWEKGVKTEKSGIRSVYVTDIDNGDFIKVEGVDFGNKGAGIFSASVASALNGGEIELRIDSLAGTKIGSLPVSNTGGRESWKLKSTSINNASWVHDLFLVFKGKPGEKLFNFDYWKFEEKKTKSELVAINASVQKYKIDTVSSTKFLPITVTAIYTDGSQKDVNSTALISADPKGIVNINKDIIEGISYGTANISVNYKGKTDSLYVLVRSYKDEHTVKRILSDKNNLTLFIGSKQNVDITAQFADGHTLDITDNALYKSSDTNLVTASNGTIVAKSNGKALVTISYADEFGNVNSIPVSVKVTNRDPYIRNKTDEFNQQSGIQLENSYDAGGGKIIGYIQNGDWIRFNSVDFGKGASSFQARVASAANGGMIEIHIDSLNGNSVGSLIVEHTKGWQYWTTNSCNINKVLGVHDIFLKFTGGKGFLFNLNWWQFKTK